MEPCTTFFLNFSFSTGKIVLSFSFLLNYFLEWNIIFVRLFFFFIETVHFYLISQQNLFLTCFENVFFLTIVFLSIFFSAWPQDSPWQNYRKYYLYFSNYPPCPPKLKKDKVKKARVMIYFESCFSAILYSQTHFCTTLCFPANFSNGSKNKPNYFWCDHFKLEKNTNL